MPSRSIQLSLLIVLCAMLLNCAQTGPPLPPSLELPKPPSDLRALRKGNQITLTWSEPARTTDRQTVRSLGSTLVCRSLESDIKECGTPVGEIAASRSGSSAQPPPRFFVDSLPINIQQQNPLGDVTYSVDVLNRDGRGAGLSNRVAVAAVPTLPPPADFRAQLTRSGVAFTWTNAAGGSALSGVGHRYRIYRREEGNKKDAIASEVSADEIGPPHAQDVGFEWEKSYLYRITSISIVVRTGGEVQIEGDDSPAVRIVAHDVFPPAVPSGLQAVYSGKDQKPFVDLIWAPVTDTDLAGYNIYRRGGDGAPVRLNVEPVSSPSYRDTAVTAGHAYSYSASAVDVRGNESARSEEASETVP